MSTSELEGKYAEIVAKVYKLTLKGAIDWKVTADSNQFDAMLSNKYLIRIAWDIDSNDRQDIHFKLVDHTGQNIVFLSISDSGNMNIPIEVDEKAAALLQVLAGTDKKYVKLSEVLGDIYAKARIQALKIDKKIDEASKLLDEIDDLPF